MATVKFTTRQNGKNKLTPVYVRLRSGRKIDQKARTGYSVYPEHWHEKKEMIRNVADATYKDDTNKKLDLLKVHLKAELAKAGDQLSNGWLVETIERYHNPDGTKDKPKTLFEYIQYFIDTAPDRINPKTGQPVSYKMQREYARTFQYLKDFAATRRRNIDFKDITLDFYHDFVAFLSKQNFAAKADEGTKYMANNTIGKKIQTLKIFLNAATDEGVNKYTHYKSHRFTAISEETEHVYLNQDELSTITDTELPPELDRMRDLFLIGCWTGLRYSDWNKVNDSIKGDTLEIKQQKTRHKISIPLHPIVQDIITKYEGQLPKVPTNQHMNRSLKEIAKKAGINNKVQTTITRGGREITTSYEKWELVSTHTARRSFATNMYKMDIPSITIMSVTGHKTETAFLKYIKVTDQEHHAKIREIWNRNTMKAMHQ